MVYYSSKGEDKMPIEFKKYFWDTEYEKLDIKKNKNYIISRLFCEGDLKSIQWLKQTYTEQEIIETVKTSRRFNPLTANFLRNVYHLKKEDMRYYRNNEEMNYSYGG